MEKFEFDSEDLAKTKYASISESKILYYHGEKIESDDNEHGNKLIEHADED